MNSSTHWQQRESCTCIPYFLGITMPAISMWMAYYYLPTVLPKYCSFTAWHTAHRPAMH